LGSRKQSRRIFVAGELIKRKKVRHLTRCAHWSRGFHENIPKKEKRPFPIPTSSPKKSHPHTTTPKPEPRQAPSAKRQAPSAKRQAPSEQRTAALLYYHYCSASSPLLLAVYIIV
jgi:hypothetical protein